MPIDLYCDENEPCTLRLEDVEISAREGEVIMKNSTPVKFQLTDVLHDKYV